MFLSSFARSGFASGFALLPLLGLSLLPHQPVSSLQVSSLEDPSLVVTTLLDTVADDGALSLREAIASVNSGQNGSTPTITFADNLNGTLSLSGTEFVLSHDVSITGNAPGIVLDAQSASRFFTVQNGVSATLRLLTLRNGQVTSSRDSGVDGGAISNSGTLVVESCTFTNNKAISTSYRDPACPPRAPNCYIRVPASGGAIDNHGTLTVRASTLSGNSGYYGGAINNEPSALLTLQNSTLIGNSCQLLGGGICSAGTLTIQNSTVTRNSGGSGGGVRVNGPTTIRNSIIVGNSGSPYTSPNISGAYDGSRSPDNLVSGTVQEAGLEVDAQGNPLLKDNGGPTQTIALMEGGYAVGLGDNTYAPSGGFDQRGDGFPRIRGNNIDSGAFEWQNDTNPLPTPTPTPLNTEPTPTATPTQTPTPIPTPVGIRATGRVLASLPNATYSGSVDEPCVNALVRLDGGGKSLTITTDTTGSYTFSGLTQAKYTLRVVSVDTTGSGTATPLPFTLSQPLTIGKKTPSNALVTAPPFTLYSVWGQVKSKSADKKNPTFTPLPSTNVQLSKTASASYPAFTRTTITDENGFYSFSFLGRASFKLIASAPGLTFKNATAKLPGSKAPAKPSLRLDLTGTLPKVKATSTSVHSS